jgi:hypothetical protein
MWEAMFIADSKDDYEEVGHNSSISPRWSYGIQCFPFRVFILFWPSFSILCPNCSILELKCLLYAIVYWKCITCIVISFIFKIYYFLCLWLFFLHANLRTICMSCAQGCIWFWGIRSHRTGVIDIWEPSKDDGNWSHLLCKSTRCSALPHHLPSPITWLAL